MRCINFHNLKIQFITLNQTIRTNIHQFHINPKINQQNSVLFFTFVIYIQWCAHCVHPHDNYNVYDSKQCYDNNTRKKTTLHIHLSRKCTYPKTFTDFHISIILKSVDAKNGIYFFFRTLLNMNHDDFSFQRLTVIVTILFYRIRQFCV